jgi:hypothetical protein
MPRPKRKPSRQSKKAPQRVKKPDKPRINRLAEESLQAWTKLIAISVRNEMENFHSQHISDDVMPELNRAIRRGIYLALRNTFLLMNAQNVADYERAKVFLWFLFTTLPDCWEDTELTPEDLASENARPGYVVLNIPRVQRAFEAWLNQHTFLWIEGQELTNLAPGEQR